MKRTRSDDVTGKPVGTFGYFFVEASRRLWISKRNSLAAILMIAIALVILGVFLMVSQNLSRAVDDRGGSPRVVVYLLPESTVDEIEQVELFLSGQPSFARRTFVSSADAVEKFKKAFPNLSGVIGEVDENPLPPSFEITVEESDTGTPSFHEAISGIRALEAVDDVQLDWEWIAKLRNLIRTLEAVGVAVGAVLAVAAAFMIANVIRLTMVLYRDEIGIMRLVGATEWIIRGPFLVEGVIQGFLGGVLAISLLAAIYLGVRHSITPATAFIWDVLMSDFIRPKLLFGIVVAGTMAGLFGSWLAVRATSEEVG